jgi:hypothetical protein
MAFWSPDEFRAQDAKNKQAGEDVLPKAAQAHAAVEYAAAVAAAYDAYEQLLRLGSVSRRATSP